jgi:hypothetical protein
MLFAKPSTPAAKAIAHGFGMTTHLPMSIQPLFGEQLFDSLSRML